MLELVVCQTSDICAPNYKAIESIIQLLLAFVGFMSAIVNLPFFLYPLSEKAGTPLVKISKILNWCALNIKKPS